MRCLPADSKRDRASAEALKNKICLVTLVNRSTYTYKSNTRSGAESDRIDSCTSISDLSVIIDTCASISDLSVVIDSCTSISDLSLWIEDC